MKLNDYTTEQLLMELISRHETMEAPNHTTWGEGMQHIVVGIGNDNVAHVYLHGDDIGALKNEIS